MSFLEFGGHRYALPDGESVVGSESSAVVPLKGKGVLPQHAVLQSHPDGQVAIRKAVEAAEVFVNGVRLGPNPTPLLHGDKVTVAGNELSFIDERKSGSTQYVQAVDPATLAGMVKPSSKKLKPTTGTGGRLVSLTDGREYTISGVNFLIGRDASCDVVITSKSVSRRHADIMTTPKGYVLVDSSTNGTMVNGARVQGQHLLARGDIIQCGEHEFRFYADVAATQASAQAVSPLAAPPPEELAPVSPPSPAASLPPKAQAPDSALPRRPIAPAIDAKVPSPPKPSTPPQAVKPAPGAQHRLADTLHGTPSIPRAEALRTGPRTGDGMSPAKPVAASHVGPLAIIVVRSGPLKGQRFPLRTPVVNVGRAEYNDVVLAEGSVSTNHAKVQRREGIWVLIDLDSTNGTMVDGERLVEGEVPLAPGALLRFGDVQCVFEPVDDTIDAPKGSSTRLLSPVKPEDTSGPSGQGEE